MQSNRHTVNMTLSLTQVVCDKLNSNPNKRIMVYCASATVGPLNPVVADISFPNQIEIKVNQDEVKSNFKGLKNKPGTTKPADITHLVRKAPSYNNSISITYALTTKVGHTNDDSLVTLLSFSQKYTIIINLVDRKSADTLAIELLNKPYKISTESVIKDSTYMII